MLTKRLLLILLLIISISCNFGTTSAQEYFKDHTFSRYDSLRGALNPMRSCYNVTFYDLNLTVNPDRQSIEGYNTIHFQSKKAFKRLQIDLFSNMVIDTILYKGRSLTFKRDSNFVFVNFPKKVKAGTAGQFTVYYHGEPIVADNPPWDGGFVWDTDQKGRHWIGVACEGIGASLWWPNKDHLSEEPDSMAIEYKVPEGLTAVANGKLRTKSEEPGGYQSYQWFVNNPINNYNVTLNIADYAHFQDKYATSGKKDSLALDYYVLDYNLEKARKQFQQVLPMLKCFEQYFGPYPFQEDAYSLVETPYLGMEHQSAIAYGNNYRNNSWGFDYIIIHETGHEWWGNSISARDLGELWIHESFTTYMEALYMECRFNEKKAVKYLQSRKNRIRNTHPVLGPTKVNYNNWPASDIYYKGAWMLHTLRNTINNDSIWFKTLRGLTKNFHQSIVSTDSITNYINKNTPRDYTNFFNQYLKYTQLPIFSYKIDNQGDKQNLHFAWATDVESFNYPVVVSINGESKRLTPSTEWQTIDWPVKIKSVKVEKSAFYVWEKEMQ